MLLPTETVNCAENGAPKGQRNLIYTHMCRKGEKAQPVPTKAFRHPAKVAAMCMAPHAEKMDCAN